MGLFDNFSNVLDLVVQGQNTSSSNTLAKRADVSVSDFGKVAAIGVPAILQAIQRNAQDDTGLDALNQALNKHQDVEQYQSVDQLSQSIDPQDGDKVLGHVFNDKQSIIDRIADTVGISPAAVKRILVLLAPLVLKYLADRRKAKNLDKEGLQQETRSAAENVTRSIQPDSNNGDLFKSILAGLTANKGVTKKQNDDDGILDDIFRTFF